MKHIGDIIREHYDINLDPVPENRKNHKWDGDVCVKCGCNKQVKMNDYGWARWIYFDPNTGEIIKGCKDNQLKLEL